MVCKVQRLVLLLHNALLCSDEMAFCFGLDIIHIELMIISLWDLTRFVQFYHHLHFTTEETEV